MNEQRDQRQRQMLLAFAKKNTPPKRKPRVSINPAIRLPSLAELLRIDAEAEADAQRLRAIGGNPRCTLQPPAQDSDSGRRPDGSRVELTRLR